MEGERGCPRVQWPRTQEEQIEFDQPTLEDCCQIMPEEIDNIIDQHIGIIWELHDEMGVMAQLVASLEQDAR